MRIMLTFSHLNVECVPNTFVPSCVTTDGYIFIRVHFFGCSLSFKLLFDQHFHSLFTCDILTARKHRCEA